MSEYYEGAGYVAREILWMARRYADGRSTFAPHTVNALIDELKKRGIEIENDVTIKDQPEGMYACDGMFGFWRNGKFERDTK